MTTKKIIMDFAKQYGCEASYSGKEKTMWIKGSKAGAVIKFFRHDPIFKVKLSMVN